VVGDMLLAFSASSLSFDKPIIEATPSLSSSVGVHRRGLARTWQYSCIWSSILAPILKRLLLVRSRRRNGCQAPFKILSSFYSLSSFMSRPLLVMEHEPEPAPINENIEIPASPPKLNYLRVENTPRAANISFKSLVPLSTSKKRGRGLQRGSDSILDRFTEMQCDLLSDAHSFYISDWTNEYPNSCTRKQGHES